VNSRGGCRRRLQWIGRALLVLATSPLLTGCPPAEEPQPVDHGPPPAPPAEVANQEADAQDTLRLLHQAQEEYKSAHGAYGSLADLSREGLIEGELSSGTRTGYVFELNLSPDRAKWAASARPLH
jgi:hypothetical protein